MSQGLYEVTLNALLDRGEPLTEAEWSSTSTRVGRNDGPALLYELYVADLVPPALLARAAADAWCGAEWPSHLLDEETWRELFGEAGYAVDGVPAPRPSGPVRLYRGADVEHREGMAWTSDPERAGWFAARPLWETRGQVWTVEVEPIWLLAQLTGRGESEYVVDPVGLQGRIVPVTSGDVSNVLTLAEIEDVLQRYADNRLSVDEAVELLGPSFDAADADRDKLRGDPDGPGPDAWHVLGGARRALGEERHNALVAALRGRP